MTERKQNSIHSYKGFDKDMKCRGFQYEVGNDYEQDGKIKCCRNGFHACEFPLDVFTYYAPSCNSRYCTVTQSGDIDKNGENSKVASSKIHIETEIGLSGIIKAGVKFILDKVNWNDNKETNTGDYSAATNTGDYSAATNTGNCSAATNTGYYSAATNTGDYSAATNTGTAQQPPTRATTQQPPTRATTQQPPTRGTAQQPPTRATTQQPPTRATAQQPPTRATTQQPPTRATTQQLPTRGTAQQQRSVEMKALPL